MAVWDTSGDNEASSAATRVHGHPPEHGRRKVLFLRTSQDSESEGNSGVFFFFLVPGSPHLKILSSISLVFNITGFTMQRTL